MSVASQPIDLPRRLGPYVLSQRLAVGGMAEVYVAKTKGVGGFEKLVAIKVIHPRYLEDEHFVKLLVEEAKISVLLSHANIVQIFDLSLIGDTYFIVMEYIDGADAQRVMRLSKNQKTLLPLALGVFTVAEMCRGLEYAHGKRGKDGAPLGIVHRDISPHNVLLSRAGEIKLVDFGIAKAALRSEQTEVGVIKGKYCYMSPEQAWGRTLDSRSDIFSTGVVLHEMLTGQAIYEKDSIPVMLDRVRRAEIPKPSTVRKDIPEELDHIVMKALAAKPEHRYQSAREFGRALNGALRSNWPAFTSESVATYLEDLLGPRTPLRSDSDVHHAEVEAPKSPFAVDRSMSVLYSNHPGARSSEKPRTSVPTKTPRLSKPAPSPRPLVATSTRISSPGEDTQAPETAAEQESNASDVASAQASTKHASPSVAPTSTTASSNGPTSAQPAHAAFSAGAAHLAYDNSFQLDPRNHTQQQVRAFRNDLGQVGRRGFMWLAKKRVWVLGVAVLLLAALLYLATGSPAPNPTLEIVSVPPGATVTLDGKELRGLTPLRIDKGLRLERTHRVELSLDGFEDWEASFQPSESVVTQVAVLQPVRASLTVTTEPPGSRIWINGAFFGVSPVEIPGIRSRQKLEVKAAKTGYKEETTTWTASSEELQQTVTLKLERVARKASKRRKRRRRKRRR